MSSARVPNGGPGTITPITLIKLVKEKKRKTDIPATTDMLGPPPTNKLFVVMENGEMMPIMKTNISTSGILHPAKTGQKKPSQAFRPIRPNFIVNNDISGGVMTMDQYRQKVQLHKSVKLSQKAKAKSPVTIYNVIRPGDLDLDSTVEFAQVVKNKPGRRPGFVFKPKEDDKKVLERAPGSLTRSGRLSRPPRHYQRFFAEENGQSADQTDSQPKAEFVEPLPLPKRRRGPIDRFKCEKCGKTYWTERKLQLHIASVHEGAGTDDSLHIDCFNYFLGKLKKVSMNLRGKIFLDEMEVFVQKIQRLMQKLIRRFEETRMKDSFLNYSQVHQIPKSMAAILNVEAGQYHFNTEIIDADEKTILGENETTVSTGMDGNSYQQDTIANSCNNEPLLTIERMGLGESTMSGFDDSSTQAPLSGGETQKDYPVHAISLQDAIYDSSNEINLIAQPNETDYYDEYPDDDDDLTTPKKDPFPSPATRRLRKWKHTLKTLNKSNETDQFNSENPSSIIRDLSMELFQCHTEIESRPGHKPN